MLWKGSRHLNHIHVMNQLCKGRKMRIWELQGQLTACSTSIKLQSHNTGNQWNFLALWAFPVQHRSQSAPWNCQGMLLHMLIKFQKYWNPHENSLGFFPSFHQVSVEKALLTAPTADSSLAAGLCLDSPNHSKYNVYRTAPFKSERLLSSYYTHP